MKKQLIFILSIYSFVSIEIFTIICICGCKPQYINSNNLNSNSVNDQKQTYACDEYDAIVIYRDGTTQIVQKVQGTADTKDGMIFLYDKWYTFDHKFVGPKDIIKCVQFVKP